LELQI